MSSEFIKPPKNEQFSEIVNQFEKNKGSMIRNVTDTNTNPQNISKHLEKQTKGGRKKSLRKTNRKRKTRRRRTNRRR